MPRPRAPLTVSLLLLTFFALACSGDSLTAPGTGTLQITASTMGAEPDPDGYTVQVDAGTAQAIGTAASVQSTDVSSGDHTVQLAGLAPNCVVSGDVFAVGGQQILHYDGTRWAEQFRTELALGRDAWGLQGGFKGVWGTSSTDIFAVEAPSPPVRFSLRARQ